MHRDDYFHSPEKDGLELMKKTKVKLQIPECSRISDIMSSILENFKVWNWKNRFL